MSRRRASLEREILGLARELAEIGGALAQPIEDAGLMTDLGARVRAVEARLSETERGVRRLRSQTGQIRSRPQRRR
jgi:hypothetical protein